VRRACVALALVVVSALAAGRAEATFSIVAVDRTSGEVGGAVASCVPLETVLRVYGAAPGRGALVTQSYLKDGVNERGVMLLAAGASAEEVLAALVDPAFDPDFDDRQYAVVDLEGGVAAFTGTGDLPYAGHERGIDFSVQGNSLTDHAVLERMEEAFVSGGGCDLAERLVLALEAAARGGGDSRCTPDGRSAESAALFVDAPEARVLALADPGVGGEEPTAAIRDGYEAWRVEHACPVVQAAPEPAPVDEGCSFAGRGGSPTAFLPLLMLALRRRGSSTSASTAPRRARATTSR
jgi:uncharacterized Ntn-hydrolase superfamily protein